MPRQDVEFKTSDTVTLRGWLYRPHQDVTVKLPCLVLSHGYTALKEMDLDAFSEYFVSKMPIACLVYDNRGFGTSEQRADEPRHEIIAAKQIADMSDAITYAQSRDDIDAKKIAVWGSSYSGGHVLVAAAIDKRVKAVISQVPMVDGWTLLNRLVRADLMVEVEKLFVADRLGRAAGQKPMTLPVVDENPQATSALPTSESFKFFSEWEKKSDWKNEVTVRTVEDTRSYIPLAHIQHISPAPLLMIVASNDTLTMTDMELDAYSKALEPKQLHLIKGGHFDAYTGPNFEVNAGVQAEFLRKNLCGAVHLPERLK